MKCLFQKGGKKRAKEGGNKENETERSDGSPFFLSFFL